MRHIANMVETGQGDELHEYPRSTPRRRLDEVKAARFPKLRWTKE
jgi:glycine dehydrogenase subunit 2